MFIRLFADYDNEQNTTELFYNILDDLKGYIKDVTITSTKPYWKIEGVYVLEAYINLLHELNEEERRVFLESISDKWLFFGKPVNESLASKTTEDCTYIMNGVYMINIHF
jgi:hypothetical protein